MHVFNTQYETTAAQSRLVAAQPPGTASGAPASTHSALADVSDEASDEASDNVSAEMSTDVLQVEHLSVAIRSGHRSNQRSTELVRDVTFSLRRGEILALVGESGAGKSMTGAAITRLLDEPLTQTGGSIVFNGTRLDTLSEREMRSIRGAKIAMIFQDPSTSLNPVFTIGRQLTETIRLHTPMSAADAHAAAVVLLEQVGITAAPERMHRYPHEFSGGMRQRVVIALALAGNPETIIADEPTTALDVSVQAQIMVLLKRLQRERGMSMILVTHDMGVVASVADRVAVMYAGRIVEMGPVADILANAWHPYTRGLMQSIPVMGQSLARLPQIEGSMPRPDAVGAGCAFAPRCKHVLPQCTLTRPPLAALDHQPRTGLKHESACWLHQELPS